MLIIRVTLKIILSLHSLVPIINNYLLQGFSKQQWMSKFPFLVVYWGLLCSSTVSWRFWSSPLSPKDDSKSLKKSVHNWVYPFTSFTFLERGEIPSKDIFIFTSWTSQKEISFGRSHQCEYTSPVLCCDCCVRFSQTLPWESFSVCQTLTLSGTLRGDFYWNQWLNFINCEGSSAGTCIWVNWWSSLEATDKVVIRYETVDK